MTAKPSDLDALVARRSLIVCVGPGGVGKTTTAAAIAARAARAGRRALVLTIDPAKRLADALGVELADTVRAVPDDMLRKAGISGQLSAAMLDTKASFDALIARASPDEASTRRVLENRIYMAISRTLARSHGYVAIERVYDVTQHGGFDLVVLDTPPMRSALDILDAPDKFVRFFEDKIIGWFVTDERGRRPRRGTAMVKLLGFAIGQETAEEIAVFFAAFAAIRGEVKRRYDHVQALLRAPTTAFVLVASPERMSLDDAAFLRDGLASRGVHLDAVVFNRAFVPEPGERRPIDSPAAQAAVADGAFSDLVARLRAIRGGELVANAEAKATIEAFARKIPADTLRVQVPRLEADLRDLGGLLGLLD